MQQKTPKRQKTKQNSEMIRWGTYKSLNKYLIGTSGSKLREGDYAPPQCFDIPTNCHSAWENVNPADIGWLLS